MKRLLQTVACVLTLSVQCTVFSAQGQTVYDAAWRDDVKTVQLYRQGAELEAPILTMSGDERLVLEFDVLRPEAENLQWHIAHCDRHWRHDDVEAHEFMIGFADGNVEEHDFSFTTRRDYVHYRSVLPDDYAEFTLSGNYVLTVTEEEGGDTLLTRRFWVSEQSVKMRAEVTRPYDGVALDQRQEVDVVLLEALVTPRQEYEHVLVQQNGRWDNAKWLTFSGYDGRGLAYRYRQENIFDGGNTFRYFDCSNLHTPMYNVARVEVYGGEQFVLLRPEEDRSRKHYITETTLNGGMKVNIWDRDNPRLEADYVWVNFSLPMAQPLLEGSVYVVGALTDWRLDSTSRMDYNPTHKAYTKRLLLKQGYYAYQLLVARPSTSTVDKQGGLSPIPSESLNGKTRQLEGDHRETPNRYTIYVYRHSPSDRADRLLSIGKSVVTN